MLVDSALFCAKMETEWYPGTIRLEGRQACLGGWADAWRVFCRSAIVTASVKTFTKYLPAGDIHSIG